MGGLEDWTQSGGELEKGSEALTSARPEPQGASETRTRSRPVTGRARLSAALIEFVARRSIGQLVQIWFWIIAVCGLLYWAGGVMTGAGLRAGGGPIDAGWKGLADSIYFSFVTALSIGYGDIVPVGALRVLAIAEGATGLLIFGCVISKLVSRRQDELLEQTHRVAFEERLGRVRTNLHLVFSEIQSIAERCADPALPAVRIRTRVESVTTVFAGELRSIHDLLYRPQEIPDEQVLESILAGVASGLRELNELLACIDKARRSPGLEASLRDIVRLAGGICGECVPRQYTPELKGWMDQIQDQSRRIA